MKKLIYLLFTILCFSSVNLTPKEKNFIETHPNIKCVTTGKWAPFTYYHNGVLQGIAIDYWRLISSKINLKYYCYINPNWNSVLEEIKNKRKDVTPISAITPKRKKYALFSKPYATFQYVIVTKNTVSFIPSLKFLKDKKIALSKKYTIMEIIKNKYPYLAIIPTKSIEESLEKVKKGEAFATITLSPVASYYLSKYKFGNLKISGITPFSYKARIMIRKDYAELLSIINKAIMNISEKEKINIYKKWVYNKNFDNEEMFKRILWISIGIILILTAYILYQTNVIKNKIEENLKLLHFATHDKLTGLYNRHILDYNLKQHINEYRRYKAPFSVIFMDIDDFKKINDTYGHEFGDYVLSEISKIIKNCVRQSDIVGRWGGEEFMIILPNTKLEEAVKVALKLKSKIETHNFRQTHITCSFGVATFNNENTDTAFIKKVDEKLYLAKSKGKNRVEY